MFSNTSLLFIIMDITLFSPIVYHFFQLYLTQSGFYKTVRRVLDIDRWYFMGTEYLECKFCEKNCCLVQCGTWSTVRGPLELLPARQYLDLITLGSYSHAGTSKTQSC